MHVHVRSSMIPKNPCLSNNDKVIPGFLPKNLLFSTDVLKKSNLRIQAAEKEKH